MRYGRCLRRSRPYKKNDKVHREQKNGKDVRGQAGSRRTREGAVGGGNRAGMRRDQQEVRRGYSSTITRPV